jgi:Tfp pilus assembly protein PilN
VTVLDSEVRLGMASARMPRVNLLPPEIAERATLRKVQVCLGAGVLAAVGVVGLMFVSASHSASSARDSLDQANVQSQQLTSQKAQYNNVTAIYNAAAAAQGQLTTAMGQEVRYSQLLHDLSLSVPSTVWLKSLSYSQAPPAAATAPVVAGTSASAAIGTVSFTGVGFSHDDLALWLESIAGLKTYGDPYFSSSTEALLSNTRKVVNFTSTANLTPAALSGRYTKPLGG